MSASLAPLSSEQRVEHFRHIFATIEEEVGQLIVGQRSIVRKILTAFFAGGMSSLKACRVWARH